MIVGWGLDSVGGGAAVGGGEVAGSGEERAAGAAIERISDLSSLTRPTRLRDYGVPRRDLPSVAEAVAERAPAKANHGPAPAEAVLDLLEQTW
jgi:alcohol dehydrogenase class IV